MLKRLVELGVVLPLPAASAFVIGLHEAQRAVLLAAGCVDGEDAVAAPRKLTRSERAAFSDAPAALDRLADLGVVERPSEAARFVLGLPEPLFAALVAAGCVDAHGELAAPRKLTRGERSAFSDAAVALDRLADLGVVARPSEAARFVLGLPEPLFAALVAAGCVDAHGELAAPRALVKEERAVFTPALLAQLISRGVLLKAGAASASASPGM